MFVELIAFYFQNFSILIKRTAKQTWNKPDPKSKNSWNKFTTLAMLPSFNKDQVKEIRWDKVILVREEVKGMSLAGMPIDVERTSKWLTMQNPFG